ncbi:MAG: TonB C-terminal domain-containing protein [Bryobacteraceae bacterium]|nr:TonB C-terminal domain-containing protein [Bryobacteraceae bacterium]MDW8379631.1 energy transducer TonB [Bryobacterales bacterium]
MNSLANRFDSPAREPQFLLQIPSDPKRTRASAVVSVLLHAVGLLGLTQVEFRPPARRAVEFPQIVVRQVTPLAAPPREVLERLTQKAPNINRPSPELDLPGLIARPERKAPPPVAALSPKPSSAIPAALPPLPAAPKIEAELPQVAQLPPAGPGLSPLAPPAVERPPEKPKLSFESVSSGAFGTGNVSGGPRPSEVKLDTPKPGVEQAVARVIQRPGGRLVVGDDLEGPFTGAESFSQQAAPGRMGSQLELLSDPQGADFRGYLITVLSTVRRNWFAVIPESARMGRRGRTVIQFAIAKNGSVPKLVISSPSGAEPLDRAAVAGISASNPFPPLPAEFRGDHIRLQLSFSYNMPR